jgi:hypothetical protein
LALLPSQATVVPAEIISLQSPKLKPLEGLLLKSTAVKTKLKMFTKVNI